jgi:hypothetical protein
MVSFAGVVPTRRATVPGSFRWSLLAAAARGTGLVAAAIVLGVVLLQATEETGAPPPASNVVTDQTTTTTTRPDGATTGLRPPSQVRVIVLNAARVGGIAQDASDELAALGYATLEPGNAGKQQAETQVLYKTGFEAEASILAPHVSENALVELYSDPPEFTGTEEADLIVVLGTELRSTTTS